MLWQPFRSTIRVAGAHVFSHAIGRLVTRALQLKVNIYQMFLFPLKRLGSFTFLALINTWIITYLDEYQQNCALNPIRYFSHIIKCQKVNFCWKEASDILSARPISCNSHGHTSRLWCSHKPVPTMSCGYECHRVTCNGWALCFASKTR